MDFDLDIFFHEGMPGCYAASYQPQAGGDPIDTVVMIDENVETYPEGPVGVREFATVITVRRDHIPAPVRGDQITVAAKSKTYTVENKNAGDAADQSVELIVR